MDSAYLRTMATQMETAAIAFRQLADAQDAAQRTLSAPDGCLLEPVRTLVADSLLATKIINMLRRLGVMTVGDLIKKSRWDLFEERGFGRLALKDVERALGERGLHLLKETEQEYRLRLDRERLASY